MCPKRFFEELWFFQRLAAKVNILLADVFGSLLLENICQAPVELSGGQLKRPNIHGGRKLTVYSTLNLLCMISFILEIILLNYQMCSFCVHRMTQCGLCQNYMHTLMHGITIRNYTYSFFQTTNYLSMHTLNKILIHDSTSGLRVQLTIV